MNFTDFKGLEEPGRSIDEFHGQNGFNLNAPETVRSRFQHNIQLSQRRILRAGKKRIQRQP